VAELLDMVEMSHRANSRLGQLSGGEQQRVAIALALANNPRILLADEPTGAVDTKTAMVIMDVMRNINKHTKLTVVIVTHDRMLSAKVDRVVSIRDGRTSSEFIRSKSYAEEMREIELGLREFGDSEDIHQQEYIVVDPVGRLQLPKESLHYLGIDGKSRLRVVQKDGVVQLLPEFYVGEEPRTIVVDKTVRISV
ncbi:MAG: ATP-binding cassette domain-containing protein, partial [Clostridia bacterium]|nr:ATP-binding cassette domain-containing protein [Clostridia bacterium]